jgi:glycosyltransferase involved in cell wall biosynthesis
VFVGRLSAEKGVETLLEAWRQLGFRPPLKLLGDGPMAAAVQQASAKEASIQWLRHAPLETVYDLVGEAMFLVLPSQCYETFARVAMEAFAKGTPVIVSKLGAMVDDGRTGLHFKPGDPPISPRKCGKFWQTRSGWRECGKPHVRNSTGTSPRKPTTRVSWRSTSKLSVGATKLSASPY